MSWLDLTDVPEAKGFEPLPKGSYNLIVTSAEEKDTKAGNKRLAIEFTVTDGQYTGRKIYEGYNLTGTNPQSVQIGKSMIKRLAACGGKGPVIDGPHELINIEVNASVKIKEGKDGYDASNAISSFKPKAAVEKVDGVPF